MILFNYETPYLWGCILLIWRALKYAYMLRGICTIGRYFRLTTKLVLRCCMNRRPSLQHCKRWVIAPMASCRCFSAVGVCGSISCCLFIQHLISTFIYKMSEARMVEERLVQSVFECIFTPCCVPFYFQIRASVSSVF